MTRLYLYRRRIWRGWTNHNGDQHPSLGRNSSSILLHYTVSKNDTDVSHYNFSADQPSLIIFGT